LNVTTYISVFLIGVSHRTHLQSKALVLHSL